METVTCCPRSHEAENIIFFAAKDGEALYSQQKQDQELTVTQIMMNCELPDVQAEFRGTRDQIETGSMKI